MSDEVEDADDTAVSPRALSRGETEELLLVFSFVGGMGAWLQEARRIADTPKIRKRFIGLALC